MGLKTRVSVLNTSDSVFIIKNVSKIKNLYKRVLFEKNVKKLITTIMPKVKARFPLPEFTARVHGPS